MSTPNADQARPRPDRRRLSGHALLDAELAGFPPRSVTVRAVDAMLRALPDTPELIPYVSLDRAAERGFGGLPAPIVERARALADRSAVDQALFVARSIDTGDTGLTIVTGVRTALNLFLGTGTSASAAQQRTDAALKALGMAYVLGRVVPDDALPPEQRLRFLTALPAGREMVAYFAAVELALPLGAEVEAATDGFLRPLVEQRSRSLASRLLRLVGKQGVDEANAIVGELADLLDDRAIELVPHAETLADTLKLVLPPVLGASGQALRDMVAAGADALPTYRLLCARLAAEACLALAKLELDPDGDHGALPTPSDLEPPPEPDADVDAWLDAGAPPDLPPATAPAAADPPLPEGRLSGAYVHQLDGDDLWLVFTEDGVFTNHPPGAADPDWATHAADGHQVARYGVWGARLVIRWADGRETTSRIAVDTYTLTIDDEVCRRADYDLTGAVLDGTWCLRGGDETWRFRPDGTVDTPAGPGRYALGVGAISVKVGDDLRVHTLFSDLLPDPARPALLLLGGRPFDHLPVETP